MSIKKMNIQELWQVNRKTLSGGILLRYIRLITPIAALLFFWVIFATLSPYFLTKENFMNILLQSANLFLIAAGMTFVIITGNIDLSVGSVEALSGSVVAYLLVVYQFPIIPAILISLTVGMACGWVNGKLHVKFGIPTFISTLGMMGIARGGALIITEGRSIFGVPEAFKFIGQGYIGEIPFPVVLALCYILIAYVLLSKTLYGKHVYSVGGDQKAARYAGVQVNKIKVITMAFASFSAAIAGIVMTSRLSSGQGTIGELDAMDAIAAVVIGGTDLVGGVGSMFGTLLGVLTIGSIRNGLNMMGVSSFWQQVAIGTIIIIAVILDYVQRQYEKK